MSDKQTFNKWISAEERLPEDDSGECSTYYLVWIEGYGFNKAMFMEGGFWKDYTAKICAKVTHWMEVSKPELVIQQECECNESMSEKDYDRLCKKFSHPLIP